MLHIVNILQQLIQRHGVHGNLGCLSRCCRRFRRLLRRFLRRLTGRQLLLHLAGLESFGRPYLAPFSSMRGFRALLRPRHIKTLYRDPALRPQDIRNQKP